MLDVQHTSGFKVVQAKLEAKFHKAYGDIKIVEQKLEALRCDMDQMRSTMVWWHVVWQILSWP